MNFANYLVIMVICYFTLHILTMIFSNAKRSTIMNANIKLEELRDKPIKTIEEQKQFINLKFPKRQFAWKNLPNMIFLSILYIIIFWIYYLIFQYYKINIWLWQAIIFIIFFPLILNLILEKFNIQKSDISIFFRGGGKNGK